MRELDLQHLIQLDCGRSGWIAEHYESKRGMLPSGIYYDSGVPKGYPDITIYLGNGLVCFVETKVKYNKASPEQRLFIERMSRLGYEIRVIYTFDEWLEFKKYLKNKYNI